MFHPTATHILSVLVVTATVLTPLVLLALLYRRTPFTLAQFVLWGLNILYTRIIWGARIAGHVPPCWYRGAVIVCNHRAPVDPFFLQGLAASKVHWMVAREYSQSGLTGRLLAICETIPVSRAGSDTRATKAAIRYCQQGEPVGIFPEGRLNTTDALMLGGRPGAALVALKARVPVVPCYVEGTPYRGTLASSFFIPARVRVVIGRPIDVSEFFGREDDREVLNQLTLRFMRAIAHLGGRDDFEPHLAGRRWKPGAEDTESPEQASSADRSA